jgi:hypothetical protein
VLAYALCGWGCGGSGQKALTPEAPPRPLGPEEIGPVPAELKHVETDAYSADVEAPPTAAVKEKVQATIVVRAKPGLAMSMSDDWRLVTSAPSDVDVTTPVLTKTSARLLKNSVTYLVTVVPLRAGVRHVTFKLGGSVCDEQFCDVVGDLLSWNLEVK